MLKEACNSIHGPKHTPTPAMEVKCKTLIQSRYNVHAHTATDAASHAALQASCASGNLQPRLWRMFDAAWPCSMPCNMPAAWPRARDNNPYRDKGSGEAP